MPRHNHPGFELHTRWMGNDAEQAQPPDSHSQNWQGHTARFRPPWWPEGEPWPPARRHWPRGMHRRPFLRRLGCVFVLLNVVGVAFFLVLTVLGLNALGVASIGVHQLQWIRPAGGTLLAVLIVGAIAGGANLRRMSVPLDELLAASNLLAEGDYSVRVVPRGPMEVRALATAFNSMAEQLQKQDQQRRAMLADVTHELRTPLTVIQGNLEGILDGLYPADETRLKSILEETEILSRLTNDLRTLALAESGSLQLRREATDLVHLVRETVAVFDSQAAPKGITLDVLASRPEIVSDVDPERIRQVLSNLMSNATRYSPPGSVVRVNLTTDDRHVTVLVTDAGPGISAADLPHIFDRYYRSADSRGMGLGLAIAKYIVEAHGGQVRAESGAGTGTTISFTLPA
jgi:two-component system, OmpR family, sensor histidine kinase BaeS